MLKNHLHAIFVYSLEPAESHQITDGMSDAGDPAFDRGGKYLYFTGKYRRRARLGREARCRRLDRPVTRSVYVVVLAADTPSPLAPESDEEKDPEKEKQRRNDQEDKSKDEDKKDAEKPKEEPAKVRIDLDDIDQRILALPFPGRNYVGLLAGKERMLYVIEEPLRHRRRRRQWPRTAVPTDPAPVRPGEAEVRENAGRFGGATVSHNGEKLLYRQGERWFIVAASQLPKPAEKPLKMDEMEVQRRPAARVAADVSRSLADRARLPLRPRLSRPDLKAAEDRYRPYLESVAHRHDLNYLFAEMLGELSLGHVFVSGGDLPEVKGPRTGCSAPITTSRMAGTGSRRSIAARTGTPSSAPLDAARLAGEGGGIPARHQRPDLRAEDNVYAAFEAKAGKSVVLKVGPTQGKDARTVTVVPVESERPLRNLAWVDENRRKVDKLSGGRRGLHLYARHGLDGYHRFNREFFAQADKEAAVVNERFNGGGLLAEYVIDRLRRPLMNYIATRVGDEITTPLGAIHGPKAMIINEMAGSGGDYMPYAFRQAGIGPLVGKRTWGGLVGIGGYPTLIDGGGVTAPHMAIWFPNGEWEVENRGVAPDIEVEQDPKAVREGRDPQLKKAVAVVMEALKTNPTPSPKRPPYPNYHRPADRLNP